MKMDKKALGGAAGAAALVLVAGAQVFDMDARIEAIEAIHPELTTGEPMGEEGASEPVEGASEPEEADDKGKPEGDAPEAVEAEEIPEAE